MRMGKWKAMPLLSLVVIWLGAEEMGKLRFDAKTERFIDNDEADKLVKRTYRKKYEIPEQV